MGCLRSLRDLDLLRVGRFLDEGKLEVFGGRVGFQLHFLTFLNLLVDLFRAGDQLVFRHEVDVEVRGEDLLLNDGGQHRFR